jgi:ribosomal protein S18 acetylase RimI-like enzyme
MAGFIALVEGHIDQLYVDPSHQRCGIGSTLLDRALESSGGPVTLHVFEGNKPARRFYEQHGFQGRDRWMNTEERAIDLLYVRDG